MPTSDISEKGLESLIVAALTGYTDEAAPQVDVARESPAGPYSGAGYIQGNLGDYDRDHAVDLAKLLAFLHATQPKRGRAARAGRGRPQAPAVSGPAAGRDRQARRGRCAAQGHQARPGVSRPLLRHALAGQRQGGRALRRQHLQRHPPTALQQGRDPARPRPLPVHQRPAGRHLRAQEPPDQADGRRRGAAVQARPRPARAALPVRPLPGPLRRGRPGGALLHPPEGQGLLVPALQQGLERRRRQPAQPGRPQDRLPLARGPHPRGPDRHHRELRPGRGGEGRAHRAQEGRCRSSRATTSSTWCASSSPTRDSAARAGAT